MPYMTFVNSMPLQDNKARETDWATEDVDLPCPNLPCSRFLAHMHLHTDAANAILAQKVRLCVLYYVLGSWNPVIPISKGMDV